MFPAPPLPRGRDLNQVDRASPMYRYEESMPSVFGPFTPASQRIAHDIKQQTPSVDIQSLFSVIEAQQAPPSPAAASSQPVEDEEVIPVGEVINDLDMPDDPPEIQPPPRPTKRAKGGKAGASKSKASSSVVNKVTTDF